MRVCCYVGDAGLMQELVLVLVLVMVLVLVLVLGVVVCSSPRGLCFM